MYVSNVGEYHQLNGHEFEHGIQKGSECMLQLFGVSSDENTCSQLAEAIGHVHVFLKQAQVQY